MPNEAATLILCSIGFLAVAGLLFLSATFLRSGITRLFCRHQWSVCRLQPLVGGTTYRCSKCWSYRHED